MNDRIDPYIALHFQDLVMPAGGGKEDFVATVEEGKVEELRNVVGVEVQHAAPIPGEPKTMVAITATPTARRKLLETGGVQALQATTRRERIPVLLHLKRADWKGEIAGLEMGSRLGRILSATASEQAIAALARDPDVVSIEASRSAGVIECATSMPWIGVPRVQATYSEKGAGAIVAIIDGGIDVLHHAFRTGNQSRILAIWDQSDSSGPTPATVNPAIYQQQSYGTLHTQADISQYIANNAVGKSLGRDPVGHGTHVASIAAGSPLPAAGFPGGVAPEADIVVVIPKLSAAARDPVSLGYSKAHVDALAFVRATADHAKAPVAANVSLGMNAGAHDGSSLLELAFDSFSGGARDPGYVVVKSAGNEFGHDGHASVQAFEGGVIPIEWQTTATPRREDYLEFWFSSSDDLKFTLVAPNGLSCTADRATPAASRHDPNGTVSIYLNLTRFHTDNGDSRLVALARNNQGGSLTVAGDWRLEIHGNAVFSEGRLHGWVERDNARAVHFSTGSANELTLSIPGTARTVIAVGACSPANPLALSTSSSRGPTRDERPKPELVAPGVGIVAAKAGTTNGLVAMTGTSMAAPHVTGAVALLLARRARNNQPQLNAAQIKAALSQCLKNFNGRWQPGFGHGGLDVVELLNAFS
jgi:subtilisin family serine protease